jgi:mono/diheme cytochrome c family protein
MKTVLILLLGLFLAAIPLFIVQAETESPALDSTDAQSLFEGRCQMCHQLPDTGMLKPQQWKLILTTMQQRMQQAGVPPLTETETGLILEYITQQSR